MRRFYMIIWALLISFCFACNGNKNNPNPTPQTLILGTWTLQQQHVVEYIDAVKKADTTMLASSNNVAQVQFNKGGTYSSSSSYNPNNGNLGTGAGSAKMSGTYKFNGDAFSMTNGLAGLNTSFNFFFDTYLQTAISSSTVSSVSFSSQINQLTVSKLSLHIETVYSVLVGTAYQTHKAEEDYLYSK